jgi:hypothetical protein
MTVMTLGDASRDSLMGDCAGMSLDEDERLRSDAESSARARRWNYKPA